jgi:hypothetical protein
MSSDRYILDEQGNPKECNDLLEWGRWFQENGDKRQVAISNIGETRVSTVFLGLDHNFVSSGEPVLFETMVFVGRESMECQRYTTRDDALAGHAKMAAMAKAR